MRRLLLVLVGLALVATACGDDGDAAPSSTTAATVRLGEPLALGSTYEDPSGAVTLTVRGVRILGDLLLADAEACTRARGPAGLPVAPTAWQLRVQGREQTLTPTILEDPPQAARPAWPETVAIDPGDCVRGKVAFRLPDGTRARELVFTQTQTPTSWAIGS